MWFCRLGVAGNSKQWGVLIAKVARCIDVAQVLLLFVEMCTWTERAQTTGSRTMWQTNRVFFFFSNSSATLEAQASREGVNDCQLRREGRAAIWSAAHSMVSTLSISWEQIMSSLFVLNVSRIHNSLSCSKIYILKKKNSKLVWTGTPGWRMKRRDI